MPTSASMVSHAITIITMLLFVHIITSYDSMIETREALGINTNALCEACTLFADSFAKGMKRTSSYNYGGGNPSWEQERLTPYATSEIRYVEIQEQLCLDIQNDDQSFKCHYFGENHEQAVENWWFVLQKRHPDIHQYLCVEKLKVCRCGRGWEEHNGRCVDVNECSIQRNSPCRKYQYCYNTEGSYTCLDCDRACDGCTGPGPADCKACAMKYVLRDSVCVHEEEDSQNDLVFWTRMFILIYILVFLGTCIFMKNYALVLTVIGIGLGIYISLPGEIFLPNDGGAYIPDFEIID